jgi:hypothetical protein
MHEIGLQMGMYVKVENFGIKSNSKKGCEKVDMPIIITIEFTMVVSSILPFEPKLVLMFFHIDSIREFKTLVQSWAFATLVVLIIIVIKGGDNKGEK